MKEFKMKKNKWIYGVLLTAALAAVGLTGCGTQNMELKSGGRGKSTDGNLRTEKKNENSGNWFSDLDTVDIEDNPISEEFFADYDITLINTWATFCGPCIREMPELEELYQEYQGQNIGIAGLLVDSSTVEIIAGLTQDERTLAKEILSQTGVTYPQLMVSEALSKTDFKRIAQFPTTFFVDKNGNFVGEAIAGAKSKEEWKDIIQEYLQKAQKQQESE